MKTRFLLSFSYIGTHFKGSAKTSKYVDVTTVVGTLETALRLQASKSDYLEASPVMISSRTDAGVHAIQNTAHVDLFCGSKFCVKKLMCGINHFCSKGKIPLRIINVCQVSKDFNARKFAKQRVYLYRIGVPKTNDITLRASIPIFESNCCYFLRNPYFNWDAFQEVLTLFPGTHDFTSFTGRPTQQEGRSPIRHLHSLYACRGKPLVNPMFDPISLHYDFWDIIAEGSSFVYRQVRRIVSASLAVGQGKLTVAGVKSMLDSPAPCTGLNYQLVPAYGLHLMRVIYDDADLAIERTKGVRNEHLELLHVLDQHKLSLLKITF